MQGAVLGLGLNVMHGHERQMCALPQDLLDTIVETLLLALMGSEEGVSMRSAFDLMFLQNISRSDFYLALDYLEILNRVWVEWNESDRDNLSVIYQV